MDVAQFQLLGRELERGKVACRYQAISRFDQGERNRDVTSTIQTRCGETHLPSALLGDQVHDSAVWSLHLRLSQGGFLQLNFNSLLRPFQVFSEYPYVARIPILTFVFDPQAAKERLNRC
jgi:hypothetical protein